MKKVLLIGVIAFAYWAYSTGQLESWIAQAELADKSISDIECHELGKVAKGQSMRNLFGARFRVLEITDLREISSSSSQLICGARVLLDDGRRTDLTVKVGIMNGNKYYEFSSR